MRVWIVQRHDARAELAHHGSRLDKGLAEAEVEGVGEVTRQLDVLALVVANRHGVGLIEQDVGGHQRRIVVETGADRLAVVTRLGLELCHAVQPSNRRKAVEDPRELGVLGDLRLQEERAALRIDARGEQRRGKLACQRAQRRGVLRNGDGVEVDDAEDVVVAILVGNPVADRANVVA